VIGLSSPAGDERDHFARAAHQRSVPILVSCERTTSWLARVAFVTDVPLTNRRQVITESAPPSTPPDIATQTSGGPSATVR
jgi:hypothetical protein